MMTHDDHSECDAFCSEAGPSGMMALASLIGSVGCGIRSGITKSEPSHKFPNRKGVECSLDAAEKSPYILIGHSFGGLSVRLSTHLYSAEVAGIVLMGTSHEDEGDHINAMFSRYRTD